MEIYIVTTNYLTPVDKNKEESVLSSPWVKLSYREARKSIDKFTKKWEKSPVLFRKVVPLDVIRKVSSNYEEFHPMCIATFKGKYKDYEKFGFVWFAIYKVKIKS
jgi:hypothetical protein